jgi:phage terminase large subunit-like protein
LKYDLEKYYYDEEAAEEPIQFIEAMLVHTKGNKAGEPFLLEEFQKELIREAFGWKYIKTGQRKHTVVYLRIPKGNGKSMLLSALSIYMSCIGVLQQKGAELYCVAGTREQARIIFDSMHMMIEENPKIAPYFECYRSSVLHKKSKSQIKVISAEAKSSEGYRPFWINFDELHVQPNRLLYDALMKGLPKIDDSMAWITTTAGMIGTFGEEVADYAKQLIDGVLENDAWLCRIYEASDDDAKERPFDEETLKSCNPGWGTIINIDKFMQTTVKESQGMASSLNSYLRYHLNKAVGSEAAWITAKEWDGCNLYEVNIENYRNMDCTAGLDLAYIRDTSSLVLEFQDEENGVSTFIPYFWVPSDTVIDRDQKENTNYSAWVRNGYLETTPGNVQDYAFIEAKICEIAEIVNIRKIAYDPYNASSLVTNLQNHGLPLTPFRQGYISMSPPTKELEKKILKKQINHGGHPVLAWQMSNVMLNTDAAGNIKVDKDKSKDKIDGIVAMVMAHGMHMMLEAEGAQGSAWD